MATKKRTTPSLDASTPASTAADTVVLTDAEKTRAALNLPADQFMLGDKVFTISDLSYDNYLLFITYAQPLIEGIVSKVITSKSTGIKIAGLNLAPEQINIGAIVNTLGKVLPDMAVLVCKNTDPEITVDGVKSLAKSPFPLAVAVFKQIKQNGMIRDFTDFFGQLTKMLTAK